MPTNQPSTITDQNLVGKTKRAIKFGASKAGDIKSFLESSVHGILPTVLADLTLGNDQASLDSLEIPGYEPSSPDSTGLVAAEIHSVSPTDTALSSPFECFSAYLPEPGNTGRHSSLSEENMRIGNLMEDIDRQFEPSFPLEVIEQHLDHVSWVASMARVKEKSNYSQQGHSSLRDEVTLQGMVEVRKYKKYPTTTGSTVP